VAGEHEATRRIAAVATTLEADDIAENVRGHLVAKFFELTADELSNPFLAPGSSWGLAEFFE
jgi:hypothetical protein